VGQSPWQWLDKRSGKKAWAIRESPNSQKRINKIMVGIKDREQCREYFRKLKILPLQSQYIYLLLLFVVNNRKNFKINSDIHNINTRNNPDLHYPQSHLSVYQKGAHYAGIKVFNSLPVPIKQLSHDTKQFKMVLKGFFVSPFTLLIGRIFQIQYEFNFKVVCIICISWLM
jgi:hypothetical protein